MTRLLRAARCRRAFGRRRRKWRGPSPPKPSGAASTSTIVRNGSRGLLWLEPLVEVADRQGPRRLWPGGTGRCRRACSTRVSSMAARTRSRHGLTEEIPYLKQQERLTFARVRHHRSGLGRRLSSPTAALRGLQARARPCTGRHRRRKSPTRGCADAAAPVSRPASSGRRCSTQPADQKYICCNADEGDSRHLRRSHADGRRSLRPDRRHDDRRPRRRRHAGLHLPPLRISARRSRAERRDRGRLRARLARARRCSAAGKAFDLEVRLGAGAYICGEETSMLESLEGKRGDGARQAAAAGARRPVRQADRHQQRDLARGVPIILDQGRRRSTATSASAARAARCRSSSPATSSTAAWSRRPSASRCASSSTTTAAAPPSGRPIRAVQVGGPLGAYLPASQFDMPLDYEAFAADRRRWSAMAASWCSTTRSTWPSMARFAMEFCADRILRQMHALPHRLDARRRGHRPDRAPASSATGTSQLLEDLCDTHDRRVAVRAWAG